MRIPRKYDLKGLSVHSPDSRGAPRPPGLGSAWSELGFVRHVDGGGRLVVPRRSGGRHTLMLHLFLNSHPAVKPPLLLHLHPGLSGRLSRARGQSMWCEECHQQHPEHPGGVARMRILARSRDATEKSAALTTLHEISGRKEVGECCKKAALQTAECRGSLS